MQREAHDNSYVWIKYGQHTFEHTKQRPNKINNL